MYLYTWNPNDACFDWSFDLVLEGSRPKIEDKQVPGKYIKAKRRQCVYFSTTVFSELILREGNFSGDDFMLGSLSSHCVDRRADTKRPNIIRKGQLEIYWL